MAVYTTIDDSGLFMETVLYSGDGAATQAITTAFQPDFSWIKDRGVTAAHTLQDAVRGFAEDKKLSSNSADAQNDASGATWGDYGSVTAVGATSFTTTLGSQTPYQTNASGSNYVAWNWKANGAGSLNEVGSIDSTVSVNTTSGFSIVQYVGDGGVSATIGHGLGVKPKMFVVKSLVADDWTVYNETDGADYGMFWNNTAAKTNDSSYFNDTEPTSTVFTIGTNGRVNDVGVTYIAYCWNDISGYSKFSSYTGNGNADGTFVYTGFKPAFAMCKQTNGANDWRMVTQNVNSRNTTSNEIDKNLYAQSNLAESSTNVDFVSNGMKIRSSSTGINGSGDSYIYMAFAESPLVNSNGVPNNAR
mgnify:CR=1 FL=1